MNILVTGGAGYIGSHTVLSLLNNDFDVIVFDNLSNSSIESIRRVEKLTDKKVTFVKGDIQDKAALAELFCAHNIDAVIHFAALKAVGESSTMPLAYYQNNVNGSLCLLEVMATFKVKHFIFSSSATVYGGDNNVPYIETMPLGEASSPYGASKVMVERMLNDVAKADSDFRAISLRYFNPIGAHESGQIGEAPQGVPNNLLPYIAQVAVGKRKSLQVFGDDYQTLDGTCERDYLHVMDLAEGHVAALKWLNKQRGFTGVEAFNLGTGKALSVLSIIRAFEQVSQQNIRYEIGARRSGDLAAFWANADKANRLLGWQATRSLEQMIEDTWRWQVNNPEGYL
ncbi:UDP-glucose 4-epimerase GalE [Thalassotalea sediminis]|uniref:UDP-glucose 4-epimerase GalE n=1 Tax=Thalassotalea sediminis TaxID=1759089 RepID=UPI002573C42E|nr:UDP-glucose 4-epimerase GalE [Thalassotalea sediminis]